jgi:hypothetical protein
MKRKEKPFQKFVACLGKTTWLLLSTIGVKINMTCIDISNYQKINCITTGVYQRASAGPALVYHLCHWYGLHLQNQHHLDPLAYRPPNMQNRGWQDQVLKRYIRDFIACTKLCFQLPVSRPIVPFI